MTSSDEKNPKGLRVIKTARDQQSINQAAKQGFWPLIKPVIPSPEIRAKITVSQHQKTGEIVVAGDYRAQHGDYGQFVEVIPWTTYYPHAFPNPYAAYLIPPDIKFGERVYLEDLIEDIVGSRWNQGDAARLESCEAMWTGKDLKIKYDPEADSKIVIG